MAEREDGENVLILIIDDDSAHRLVARNALEQVGFAVEEAKDGEQGFFAVLRTRPDLVLLDVMMPKFDGYEFCAELRRDPEFMNLPVLMVTALDDFESINRAYEVGATNFVTKPVNWTALAFHVKYIMRASQNAEELCQVKQRMKLALEEELDKTKRLLALALESAEVIHKKRGMVSGADLEPSMADNS
jgi:two-component system sensor histidine kinase ChiS